MTHSLFISESYELFSFGVGKHGELGLGPTIKSTDIPLKIQLGEFITDKNQQISFFSNSLKVKKVFSFIRSSFILYDNGDLYCFGSNRNNELGLLSEEKISDKDEKKKLLVDIFTPMKNIAVDCPVVDVKSCFKHTIIITQKYKEEDNANTKMKEMTGNKNYNKKHIYLGCGNNSKGALGLSCSTFDSVVGLQILNKAWSLEEEDQDDQNNYNEQDKLTQYDQVKVEVSCNNTIILTSTLYSKN